MILLLALTAAAAEPVLLDAGTVGSPVMDGFERLAPDGGPRATWRRPPDQALLLEGPDPLVSDGIEGGLLHFDLAPGRWTLRVMLGGRPDPWGPPEHPPGEDFGLRGLLDVEVPEGEAWLPSPFYAANPFPVFREGETEWHRQVAPRDPWHEIVVQVGEQGLLVEPYGAPLQALVAVPAGTDAEAVITGVQRGRAEWYHRRVAPQAVGWELPGADGGPLRVQVAGWRDLPSAELATSSPSVLWEAAPGERVTAVLWLFPGDRGASVELQGAVPLSTWEVHWLDSPALNAERRPRPAFLRPAAELRGGQGVPVGLAVTGRAPDVPGTFEGTLRIRRGEEVLEVPWTVEVLDLKLAQAPIPVGFFLDLRPPLTWAFGHGSEEVLDAYRRDLGLLRALGFDALAVRRASPARWDPQAPDTALFEEAARAWRERSDGLLVWTDPALALGPWYRDAERPLAEAGLLARAFAEAARPLDAWLYVYDEEGVKRPGMPERSRALIEVVREAAGPVQLAGCTPHPMDWLTVAPTLDAACLTWSPPLSSAHADLLRSRGVAPWAYNLPAHRSSSGLVAWATGVEALLFWSWNDARGDPFDEVTREHFQYTFLGPGGEIWPSVWLMDVAEGLIDQRYLATAEANRRATAVLDAARAAADGADVRGPHDGGAWTEEALDALRARLRRVTESR